MSMNYKNYLLILFLSVFLLIFIGLFIHVSAFVTELEQVKQELIATKILVSSLQKEVESLKAVKVVATININSRTVGNYFILAIVGTLLAYYTYVFVSSYGLDGGLPGSDASETLSVISNESSGNLADFVFEPAKSEEVFRIFKNNYLMSEEVVNVVNNFTPKVVHGSSLLDVDYMSEYYTSILPYSDPSESLTIFIDVFTSSL